MQFNFDAKELKRYAAITFGIAQALFIQGCYYNDYNYDYGYYGGRYGYGRYRRYEGWYCDGDFQTRVKIEGTNRRCDICVLPNGNTRQMYCYEDWNAWNWVWAGIGIFLLVIIVCMLIWCCVGGKKKGKVYADPNDPNAPLVVTTQQTGANSAQYTVAQLQADNARDQERQRQINERMQNRQTAINALGGQQQQVTATAGQEVIVGAGDHIIEGSPVLEASVVQGQPPPSAQPARRQNSPQKQASTAFPTLQQPPAASSTMPADDEDVFSPSNQNKV